MRYTAAFNSLGYEIRSPRNQVSSEKTDGVAISVRREEHMTHAPQSNIRKSFDTREVPGWEQLRMHLPGNNWRKNHLQKAIDEFDGRVDVILWDGKRAEVAGRWTIAYFDAQTGHHRVELI